MFIVFISQCFITSHLQEIKNDEQLALIQSRKIKQSFKRNVPPRGCLHEITGGLVKQNLTDHGLTFKKPIDMFVDNRVSS